MISVFKGPNNSGFHYDIVDFPILAADATPILESFLLMITPT